VFVPYVSKHPVIPYVAPDPGSLPRSLKKEDVDRKQVSPVYIPIKAFMQRVYNQQHGLTRDAMSSSDGLRPKSPRGGGNGGGAAATGDAPKSPRGLKISPRRNQTDETPITDPVSANAIVLQRYRDLVNGMYILAELLICFLMSFC
jgi:hypothetical protein